MSERTRQRKTVDPCEGCGLHRRLCLCAEMPRLDLQTRVLLVIHSRETKRTTNTGRLVLQSLINSVAGIRGGPHAPIDFNNLLVAGSTPLLLFPSENAQELTSEFTARHPGPFQLIVPDGNWRQASKVHTRYPALENVQRVKLVADAPTTGILRHETKPGGMATLEAVAHALTVLESPEVGERLLELYRLKCERTLMGRGVARVIGVSEQNI